MTDDLLTQFRSDVPLPDEATARRIYARATSTRRRLPRRRLVLAGAAAGMALAAGLSYALVPGSRVVPNYGNHRPSVGTAALFLTPGGKEIGSSVDVEMRSWIANPTLELQVMMEAVEPGSDPLSDPNFDPWSRSSQVVFEERVPNTPTPPGGVGWSGTLSTRDWDGGCQRNSIYSVRATELYANDAPAGYIQSEWFTCGG